MIPFLHLLCAIGLPLGLAIIVGSNSHFRPIPTLVGAVAGEVAGFLLLFFYNEWKAARILSHKEAGAVLRMAGAANLRTRASAALFILALGLAIGLLVLIANWAYLWIRSAFD